MEKQHDQKDADCGGGSSKRWNTGMNSELLELVRSWVIDATDVDNVGDARARSVLLELLDDAISVTGGRLSSTASLNEVPTPKLCDECDEEVEPLVDEDGERYCPDCHTCECGVRYLCGPVLFEDVSPCAAACSPESVSEEDLCGACLMRLWGRPATWGVDGFYFCPVCDLGDEA